MIHFRVIESIKNTSSRCFLGCNPVWCCGSIPTFQRSTLKMEAAWTSETLVS